MASECRCLNRRWSWLGRMSCEWTVRVSCVRSMRRGASGWRLHWREQDVWQDWWTPDYDEAKAVQALLRAGFNLDDALKRYCAAPGCSTLVDSGRCPSHAKQADQGTRGTAAARGYDARWARYSIEFRKRHPFCGEQADGTITGKFGSQCASDGIYTHSECVDHIVPVSRAPERFWDETNHQALCLACNGFKAQTMEKY